MTQDGSEAKMIQDGTGQESLRTGGEQRKPWQAPLITDAEVALETLKHTSTPETLTPVVSPKSGS